MKTYYYYSEDILTGEVFRQFEEDGVFFEENEDGTCYPIQEEYLEEAQESLKEYLEEQAQLVKYWAEKEEAEKPQNRLNQALKELEDLELRIEFKKGEIERLKGLL